MQECNTIYKLKIRQEPSFYYNVKNQIDKDSQIITTIEYFATKEDALHRLNTRFSNNIFSRLSLIPEKDCKNIEVLATHRNDKTIYFLQIDGKHDVLSHKENNIFGRHEYNINELNNMQYSVRKNYERILK
jgi:hypothetical protein